MRQLSGAIYGTIAVYYNGVSCPGDSGLAAIGRELIRTLLEVLYNDEQVIKGALRVQKKEISDKAGASSEVKVLLCEDVEGLGWFGDVVEVSTGYARNYLLPGRDWQ